MIEIDGSQGEGGGQVLRTSLTLAAATGQPFRIEAIRAGRSTPGLLRQHLTAIEAARTVSDAEVEGASPRSTQLAFRPGPVRAGEYHFAVGTAGSATLVLQTILPLLLTADAPSTVVVEGGTHNKAAPPFDFFDRTYLAQLRKMGARVEAALERPGFYPAGGGRIRVTIEPTPRLEPLTLDRRGRARGRVARALCAQLPERVAERELKRVAARLSWKKKELQSESYADTAGPGNALLIELEFEEVTEIFTGFGARNVRAEAVADEAIRGARDYLPSSAPAGEHLADQLLVPFALAGRGQVRTTKVSRHTETNLAVIDRFLPIETRIEKHDKNDYTIELKRR